MIFSLQNQIYLKPRVSLVQVLCRHHAKTLAEQKQCYNIGVPPLKLSMRAKRSTLYASDFIVVW